MTVMNIAQIVDTLERLEQEAAPAPWAFAHCTMHASSDNSLATGLCYKLRDAEGHIVYPNTLIALSRNALPALLAELKRLWIIESRAKGFQEAIRKVEALTRTSDDADTPETYDALENEAASLKALLEVLD